MKSLKINTKLASLVPCEKIEDSVKKAKLECSQISENIFISGYNVSLDLDYLLKENFTHILNCAYGSKNFKFQIYDNFEYLLLDLKDEPEFDIIYAIYLSIDFLEKCEKKNGKVLIHCVEGISRGPALLASFYMWKYNYDKNISINFIKEKRRCVDINLGFMVQLGKWEEVLLKKNEMKFYNFGWEGNISLVDKNELGNFKECEINNTKFSIILMLHGGRFYKLVTNTVIDVSYTDKVTHFISLLQKYEKYPTDCTSLYIDTHLLNKNFFEFHIEEILKYSCFK